MMDMAADYARRKARAEVLKRQIAESEGASKEVLSQLQKETGAKTEKEAEQEKAKIEKLLVAAETEYTKACEEYDSSFGEKQ